MKPRRQGKITEYQNGHYFLYVTEWDASEDGIGRQHREIEVYYAKARIIETSDDPIWNTTDPQIFDKALARFHEDPGGFRIADHTGQLPAR